MAYLNGKYYSVTDLKKIYYSSTKTERLTFNTFYQRIQQYNWSFDKALSYPVRKLSCNVIKEISNDNGKEKENP